MTTYPNIDFQTNTAVVDILNQFKPSTAQPASQPAAVPVPDDVKASESKPVPSSHETEPAKTQEGVSDKVQSEGASDPQDDAHTPEAEKGQEPSQNFEKLYAKASKELESKSKVADDNQRHARRIAANLVSLKSQINEMLENGRLDEETSSALLETASKNIDADSVLKQASSEVKGKKTQVSEWENLVEKARIPFANYLELSPNYEEDNKKAQGFDMACSLMSEEERQQVMSDLKQNEDSPKDLLKSMMSIGSKFWESRLGRGIAEHGNLIGVIDAQDEQIDALNKKIEGLMKTIAKEQSKDKEKDSGFDKTVSGLNGRASSSIEDRVTKFTPERFKASLKGQGVPDSIIDSYMQ